MKIEIDGTDVNLNTATDGDALYADSLKPRGVDWKVPQNPITLQAGQSTPLTTCTDFGHDIILAEWCIDANTPILGAPRINFNFAIIASLSQVPDDLNGVFKVLTGSSAPGVMDGLFTVAINADPGGFANQEHVFIGSSPIANPWASGPFSPVLVQLVGRAGKMLDNSSANLASRGATIIIANAR